jgi:hypothetical protein
LEIKDKLLHIGREFVERYPVPERRQKEYTAWYRENRSQLWPFEDYKFIDDGGIYTGMRSVHNPGKEGYRYDVIHPLTGKACTQPMMGYRFPKETLDGLIKEGRIIFGADESKLIELKVYVKDYRAKLASLFELDGRIGTNELKEIFPDDKRPFDFPKPTELIEELISFATSGDDLILDSFAGSGTTGHAVMKLNRADQQRRKFILIEMKQAIARKITAERLRRVSAGYKNRKGEMVEGLGGGFRYCGLGDLIFDETGQIRRTVGFSDLARHVFFAETGEPLPRDSNGKKSPLIGVFMGTAYYLLFNGILGDKQPDGGNILTGDVLARIPHHKGPRVIFGEGCRLGSSRLKRELVTFRQIPYEIRVS